MTPRWGVMFEDGSVATEWSGPTARARCEADILQQRYLVLVQLVDGEWVEEWPRPRFRALAMRGPFDGPRIALECLACGYMSTWHGRAAGAVPAFEEHWRVKRHRLADLGIEEVRTG